LLLGDERFPSPPGLPKRQLLCHKTGI
jgi:hypothetical protein